MGGNGTAQFAYQSPDLVKVLNAARKGNFKVRIPAKNGAVPPEVAAGLNQVFAVNQRMAQELEELRRERKDLLRALEAFEEGDFAARAAEGPSGSPVVRALNNVIGMNQKVAGELVRVSRAVGKEGRLFERAVLKKARGSWGTSIAAVNTLIGDLVQPTIEVASVIGEVAEGNLSRTMPLEIEGRPVKGAFLQMANTINTMVGQLKAFASEVTRVAREVGT
ncbi:MAG: hybrid sensor histidine kinase/response regulator, partial [Acidobacteria bacterium]